MKPLLLLVAFGWLWGAVLAQTGPAPATETQGEAQPAPAAPPKQVIPSNYQEYLALLLRPENVSDCVRVIDDVVDRADGPDSKSSALGGRGETSLGLVWEFRRVESNDVIAYQLTFSRGGLPMQFSDAVKFISLFADRAGLLHPIDVREGERPIFYAQWLFRAKDWKELRPKMLALRQANRAEKDLVKAFALAVTRELDARQSTRNYRE